MFVRYSKKIIYILAAFEGLTWGYNYISLYLRISIMYSYSCSWFLHCISGVDLALQLFVTFLLLYDHCISGVDLALQLFATSSLEKAHSISDVDLALFGTSSLVYTYFIGCWPGATAICHILNGICSLYPGADLALQLFWTFSLVCTHCV